MKKIFKRINETPEFSRGFKKLKKRFRSLSDDFDNFINTQLNLEHKLNIHNNGIILLHEDVNNSIKIFKAKKFACKSLKGRGSKSGIRVVYAYLEEMDTIEFIEIYFKGNQTNENRQRIKAYLKYKCNVTNG